MLLEMHSHTEEHSSCSHVTAEELTKTVYAKGLQGVVFTDHHYLWPAEEIQEIRQASGVPDRFLILSGQEVHTSDLGDVLVLGADHTIPPGWLLEEIRTRFPEAALVWAHPYREGKNPSAATLLSGAFDAVEILNSNHTVSENSRALKDWYRYKFTALAGTDTHGASYAGTYPTLFDHSLESIQALAEEVKKGRCRPFLKALPT
jgi:predicted metal-dependent phosphoesterase TrpH